MTVKNDVDRLVQSYLGRLAREADPLPVERRTELLAEVASHIAEARAAGADSPAAIRTVLEQLGDPEEIVAAATEGLVQVNRVPDPRFRSREVAALLLLPFGGFLCLVGWFGGVALLWASDRWTSMEKLLGTLALPLGYLPVLMLGTYSGRPCVRCSEPVIPDWFLTPVLVALLATPMVVSGLLIHRAGEGRADL